MQPSAFYNFYSPVSSRQKSRSETRKRPFSPHPGSELTSVVENGSLATWEHSLRDQASETPTQLTPMDAIVGVGSNRPSAVLGPGRSGMIVASSGFSTEEQLALWQRVEKWSNTHSAPNLGTSEAEYELDISGSAARNAVGRPVRLPMVRSHSQEEQQHASGSSSPPEFLLHPEAWENGEFNKRRRKVHQDILTHLEIEVHREITMREEILQVLRQTTFQGHGSDENPTDRCRKLLTDLREVSLQVIEAILSWRRAKKASDLQPEYSGRSTNVPKEKRPATTALVNHKQTSFPPLRRQGSVGETEIQHSDPADVFDKPIKRGNNATQKRNKVEPPFFWKGQNYLLKMLNDVEFVGTCAPMLDCLPPDVVTRHNPFLLAHGLEDLKIAGAAGMAILENRMRAGVKVLLEEDELYGGIMNSKMLAYKPPPLEEDKIRYLFKDENPPSQVIAVLACAKMLLTQDTKIAKTITKKKKPLFSRTLLGNPDELFEIFRKAEITPPISSEMMAATQKIVNNPKISIERLMNISPSAGRTLGWLKRVLWMLRSGQAPPTTAFSPEGGGYDGFGGRGNKHNGDLGEALNEVRNELGQLRNELQSQGVFNGGKGGFRSKRGMRQPEVGVVRAAISPESSTLVYEMESGTVPILGGLNSHDPSTVDLSLQLPENPENDDEGEAILLASDEIVLEDVEYVAVAKYDPKKNRLKIIGGLKDGDGRPQYMTLSPEQCHQLTGLSAKEVSLLPEDDKVSAIGKVWDSIAIRQGRWRLEPMTEVVREYRSLPIRNFPEDDPVQCELVIKRNLTEGGFIVSAYKREVLYNGTIVQEEVPTNFTFSVGETEALTFDQDGLFDRMMLFGTETPTEEVAMCFASRAMYTENGEFIIDREIKIPKRVSLRGKPGGPSYTLCAHQKGEGVVIEAMIGGTRGLRTHHHLFVSVEDMRGLGAVPPLVDPTVGVDESGKSSKGRLSRQLSGRPSTVSSPTPSSKKAPDKGFFSGKSTKQLKKSKSLNMKNETPALEHLIKRVVIKDGNMGTSEMVIDRVVMITDIRIKTGENCQVKFSIQDGCLVLECSLRFGTHQEKIELDQEDVEWLLQGMPLERQDQLSRPENLTELCQTLAKRLRVEPQGQHGLSIDFDNPNAQERHMLVLAYEGVQSTGKSSPTNQDTMDDDMDTGRMELLGAVEVSAETTLLGVRKQIEEELESEQVPPNFRFLLKGAPVAPVQEISRRAVDCLPICFLREMNTRASFSKRTSLDDVSRASSISNRSSPKHSSRTPLSRYNARKKSVFPSDNPAADEPLTPHPNQPMVLPGMNLADPQVQETLKLLQQLLAGLKSQNQQANNQNSSGNAGGTNNAPLKLQDLLAGLRGGNNSKDVLKKKKLKKAKTGIVHRPMFSRKKREEEANAKAKVEEEKKRKKKKKKEKKQAVDQMVPFPLQCTVNAKEGATVITWNGDITEEDCEGMGSIKVGTVDSWEYIIDRIDFEEKCIYLLEIYNHGKLSRDAQIKKEQIYKAAQLERLVNSPGAGNRKNPNDAAMDFFGAASQLQAAEARAKTADIATKGRGQRGKDRLDSDFWEEEERLREEAAREQKEKEERERIEAGTLFEDLLCWRTIPKSKDDRPQWRIDFDDGIVPYGEHFADSKKFEMHFDIPVGWPHLEKLCVDSRGGKPMHFQRLDSFVEVPRDMIIRHTFDTICLTPPALKNWMDASKWSKFVKALNLFPPNKARQIMTKIDLAFTRQAVKNKKKKGFIDLNGFKSVMKEIALLRFPELRKQNPRKALNDLLYKYCVNIPDVREKVWCDAKLIAMKKEAVVQAAAIRIQARVRVVQAMESYRNHLRATIKIEAMWRRGNTRASYRSLRRVFNYDRIFRFRHISAMQIQKVFRCFLWYKRFKHYQKQRRLEAKKRLDAWRLDKRKKRRIRESNTFFKLVRNINGQTVMIRITRASMHASAKQNLSMRIEAYVPKTQETFRFKLDEADIRQYLMKVLDCEGLSMGEILDPNHLILISNRLMCRIVNNRPIILLSRRTVAERGVQLMRQAQKLNDGEIYVMTVYRSTDEIALQAFHPKSCDVSRAAISNKVLKEWLKKDERRLRRMQERAKKAEIADARKTLKLREVGVVVEEEDYMAALAVLDKHQVGLETRPPTALDDSTTSEKAKGKGKQKQQKKEEKTQAHFASYLIEDPHTKGNALVAKRKTSTDDLFLGLEMMEDGETSNDPELLREGNEKELIKWLLGKVQIMMTEEGRLLLFDFEAERRSGDQAARTIQGLYWMQLAKKKMRVQVRLFYEKRRDMNSKKFYYVNLKTNVTEWDKPRLLGSEDLDDPPDEWRQVQGEDGKTYYMNPGTGQITMLTEGEAVRTIQKLVRRFLSADFGQLPLKAIVTALRIQAFATKKFKEDPERLSNVVNMALLYFTHFHDLEAAKPCFKAAMEMAPHNPIVLRAAALFQLARCDPPRWRTFTKAQDMLKEADQRDKDRSKFYITEEAFFHYEVIMTPHNSRALMNFALLMQCVVKDFDRAERFYRRALTESPNDPQLRKNFEDFEERRVPGGAYAGGGPPSSVVKRSMVYETKPEWGEWSKMKDMNASDDRFQIFWYNKFTMITKWDEPNWKEAWQVRKERSEVVKDLGRWNEMYDPPLEQIYFWNKNTNAFQIKDPFL